MSALTRDQLVQAIDTEWPLAMAHAGFTEGELTLWKAETSPSELDGIAAQCFGPYQDPDRPYAFSPKQFAEATSKALRDRHRIVMHLDYDYSNTLSQEAAQALVGAILRHELEHAKQQERWGPDLFNIYDQFVLAAMGNFFGGSIPNAHINLVPVELDANAAAASYLRQHHPSHIAGIIQTNNGNTARIAKEPQSRDTLMGRMIAFLYVFREAIEEISEEVPVQTRLELYSEEAAETWSRLTDT